MASLSVLLRVPLTREQFVDIIALEDVAGLFILEKLPKGHVTRSASSHSIALTDVELRELERCSQLDPYAGYSWIADTLRSLVRVLSEREAELRREVEVSVLGEVGQTIVQDWMAPLVELRLSENESHRAVLRLMDFARRAEAEKALLAFEGD